MHMPIASTQLLSTTNFIQSFGQWTPILANDNNLNANTASVSTLTVSSIYGNYFSTGRAFISTINGTNIATILNPTILTSLSTSSISTGQINTSSINADNFSTGSAFISSINGQPISLFINTGDVTFTSVSTNSISTGQINTSSIYVNYISSGNAYISSINANSLSTAIASVSSLNANAVSTATAIISSINGYSIYDLLNKTPSNLSANTISTTTLFAQTAYISSLYASTLTVCNLIENYASTTTGYFDIANISTASIFGNLVFSTMAKGYDISKVYNSTVTTYDKVSSLTQDIIGYQMNLTTTGEPESFDMGSFIEITAANSTLWSKKQLTYSGVFVPGQAPTINIIPGSFATGDYFDVKNIATNGQIVNIWNPYISGGLLLQMVPGTYYRFTYNGSAWTYAANPTPVGAAYTNTFAISQGWDQTTISTGNILNLVAGEVNIPGFTSMDKTNINYLTAGGATFSTIVSPYVSTGLVWLSSINNTNITTILNPTTLPYLSTTSISTAQIKTSSIYGNTLTFNGPLANPTGSWDINRTFYSNVVTGSYDSNVSSLTAQILNYSLSATIPNEATFYFGSVFTVAYNDALWASQFLVANLYSGGTINLLQASANNYFDCQNQSAGSSLQIINYLTSPPTTLLVLIQGNTTIYRFTATVTAGVTTWSYAVSPGIYTPTTVANNLLISADLQNTYISSINRVQFNTGDVYFASPIYAPNAYIDNFILNNLNASTVTTKIANITNATISTANISTLAATSINTSSFNTTSLLSLNGTISSLVVSTMTIGNESIGTLVAGTQITTSQTFANGGDTFTYPFYSIVNWTTPQNYLSNISSATLFASQFNYTINQGYVNLNLGLICNIAIDSNLNVVATNSRGATTSFSGISSCIACTFYPPAGAGGMYITMQTPTAALLASGYSFYISNTAATGGVDRCYNTGFYTAYNGFYTVQSYVDFKLAHVFSGAGSGQAAFEVVPLSPFPYAPHNPAINDAVALTHRAGNAISLNATSNINFNTCNTNFNSLSVTACNIQGASWFANLGGGYISWGNSTATGGGTLSYKGTTFPVSQYNCTIALAGTHVSCNAYGIAQTSLNAYNNGGYWAWSGYLQIQGNVHTFDPNLNVSWDGSVQMTPKPFVSLTPDALYDISGNPWFLGSTLSTLTTIPFLQEAFVSSMTASTLTIKAAENVAILANLSPPTFLGNGTVAINANSNVDLMANYDITAGAGHNISMTATNGISITSPGTNFYGPVGINGNDLYMNSRKILDVQNIRFLSGDINTGSNYTDIHGGGPGTYTSLISGGSYYTIDTAGSCIMSSSNVGVLTAQANAVVESRNSYVEFIARGGSNNIYFTGAFMEFRGNMGFTGSNKYINNLAHIYGDTNAGGGGLAIDYMYGMFFNSAGHNANFFVDGSAQHMINYNSGIEITSYCSNGAGNVSLYSASNEIYLSTGPNHDINLNGGRYVSVNAAQPGGSFGIYASTINATTLLDMNFNTGAGRNININTSGFNIITGNLDMFGNNIINVHDIGSYADMSIHATYAGNATVSISANSNINLTSGTNIILNGPITANSNLFMNNHTIYNAFELYNNNTDLLLTGLGRNIILQTASAGTGIYLKGTVTTSNDVLMNGGLLQMNCNAIRICSDQYHALAFGNSGTYNVGVNGPYLVGYNNGALGTSGTVFNDKSLEWSYTDVYVYKRLDMCNNSLSNVLGIRGTTSNDISLSSDSSRILYLTGGTGVEFTSYGVMDIYSYGATNMYSFNTCNINITSDGNINLTQTRTGKQLALYGYDVPITGINTVTINTKYSTWTGSNNFNILTSNIGITSSNAFDIVASGSGVLLDGDFKRKLSGTNISQPIVQYGSVTGSGASGSVTVTLPVAYTSATSYVVTASMMDTTAAKMSANRDSASQITIYWSQAGSGSQTLGWNTMGL